jgi:WD40 repeat protein
VVFSPDGDVVISGSISGELQLWNIETGESFASLQQERDYTEILVAFSPDGATVASANYTGNLNLWDTSSGDLQERYQFSNILAIGFEADGSLLAALAKEPNNLEIWDVNSNTLVANLLGHRSSVIEAVFSINSQLLLSTEAYEHTILWNIATEEPIEILDGTSVATLRRDNVALAWTSRNRFESEPIQIKVKNLSTQEILELEFSPTFLIKSLTLSPDRQELAIVASDSLVICQLSNGECQNTENNFLESILTISLSPDGRLLAFSQEFPQSKQVQIWNMVTNDIFNQWETPSSITTLLFESDGNILEGDSGRLRIWDIYTGEQLTSYSGFDQLYSTVFNSEGTVLACSGSVLSNTNSKNILRFWDLENRELVVSDIETPYGVARDIAFLPSETQSIAAVSLYQTSIQLWDISHGYLITSFNAESEILSIDIDPLGQFLAAGTQDSLLIWSIESNSLVGEYRTESPVLDVKFSPQQSPLAYTVGKTIYLLNLEELVANQSLIGHTDLVTELVFSSDGQYLFSGSADGTVRQWQLANLVR